MKQPLLLLSLFSASALMAQPVFQSTDYQPPVGTDLTFRATDYRAPGPATNGFVYDLSTLPVGAASVTSVLLPSTTPYASTFPTATHATTSLVNPQNYGYTRLNATESVVLGIYGPSIQILYDDPQQMGKFPLALGTTWNDNFAGTQTVNGLVVNRSGTSTGNYNGYGTVILPFGTFTNVARLEQTQTYEDNYMGITSTTIVHSVNYLKLGLNVALFSTSYTLSNAGGSMDTISTSGTLIDPSEVGIHELGGSIHASVWPNPATNRANLELEQSAGGGLSVALYDATGRLLRSVPVNAGVQLIALDLSGLRPGLYFVRATDGEGAMGNWPLTVE